MSRLLGFHNPRSEQGAVMVMLLFIVLVLCMFTALGMETFRLLTSRIQMQNIAEYVAEVALSDLRAGSISSPTRINEIILKNYFLAQGTGDFGSCIFPTNCDGKSVIVSEGCFSPSTNTFVTGTSSACIAPAQQSVHIRITTLGGRQVTKMLANLFFSARIDISTSAFSYWYVDATNPVVQYYVTGPFSGTKS